MSCHAVLAQYSQEWLRTIPSIEPLLDLQYSRIDLRIRTGPSLKFLCYVVQHYFHIHLSCTSVCAVILNILPCTLPSSTNHWLIDCKTSRYPKSLLQCWRWLYYQVYSLFYISACWKWVSHFLLQKSCILSTIDKRWWYMHFLNIESR